MSETTIDVMQMWLTRLQQGDDTARDRLIDVACKRLTILTRRMLNDFDRLRQWEQTDDVFQNSMLRLAGGAQDGEARERAGVSRAGSRGDSPRIARHVAEVFRAAAHGRARRWGSAPLLPGKSPAHVKGKLGAPRDEETPAVIHEAPDTTNDPSRIVAWTEFHQQIESLPADQRELVNLLYYEELPQEEVAQLLGVDKRTVKRRWREVRRELHKLVKDWLPGA